MNEDKLEIKTPMGVLVVYPSNDPLYPGVYVDLRQPNGTTTLNLATVECQLSENGDVPPKLVTHVWGDAQQEDSTHDIDHQNIPNSFRTHSM